MRYTILHPWGDKPPSNTLDVDRWADLEKATANGTTFLIEMDDGATKMIHVKGHTEQLLRTLMLRPVKASSRCRLSQYKSALLDFGGEIDCEGYRADDRGRDSYGVYFIQTKVTPLPPVAEAA